MQVQSPTGRRSRLATRIVVLVLIATAVLVACSPAFALRPRTTPAHAASLAAQQDGGARVAHAATLHGREVARILARHMAAAGGAAVSLPRRGRAHHAVAMSTQGVLAVATLAAMAAGILVIVAVLVGERRQVARRRQTEEAARPAAAPGHQIVS